MGDPYEALRGLTRGKTLTLAELHEWVEGLPVDAKLKARMKTLRPSAYAGLATVLCERVAAEAAAWLAG
jgi:adenylosuccinate lyase